MKKLAIAGASVALAAMPVVGVFADTTSHTDTINLTLSQVCTLGTVTTGTANADDATTHNPTEASGDYTGVWTGDTLAATVSAGNTYTALGTTTFTIRCNDDSGYQLKAASGTNDGDATTPKATLVSGTNTIKSADGSGYAAGTAGTSYWNFKLSAASTGLTIANGYNAAIAVPTSATTIASAAGAGNLQDGQSVTVTYGAGIDNHQATGTYAGTVVYTLVAL